MQAKEYMLDVRRAEAELELIAKKRQHYQDLAASIGVKLTGTPGSGQRGTSQVETAAVGLASLVTELAEKEKRYVAAVRKAEALIDKLPQEKFRKILTMYYLLGYSSKTIRDEMQYKDEKSVYHCRDYALQALQEVM